MSTKSNRKEDSMKVIKHLFAAVLALATTVVFAAVDVNNASVADLDSIKGIGPGTSAKILDGRKSAKFKDWGDFIERVPGIGDKRAAKLSAEGLTVNGEAFKGAPTKPSKTTEKVANRTPAKADPSR
jgi:competence protein ComEA